MSLNEQIISLINLYNKLYCANNNDKNHSCIPYEVKLKEDAHLNANYHYNTVFGGKSLLPRKMRIIS